jgi:WD40 repeat protein
VHLWDGKSGQELARTMGGAVLALRFGADGAQALVAAADNSIELYDVASGRRLRVFRGHIRKPVTAAFSPDGQRFASIGDDQSARIWNVADGRQLFAITDAKLSRDVAIRLGADRALVPMASGFRLYAIAGAKLLAELPVEGEGAQALFGANDAIILTAASGATAAAKLWDGATGKALGQLEQGSTCLDTSRDGRELVTGSREGIGRIWSFERPADAVALSATPAAQLERAKAQVGRCLTREQRGQAFLAAEPPAWCIELGKWPYQTQAWKDWLKHKRDSADPPVPPWRATATAGHAEPVPPAK